MPSTKPDPFAIVFDGVLFWYLEAHDPGEDRCSKCRELIDEEDVPLILFKGKGRGTMMARLHDHCAQLLVETGKLTIGAESKEH